MLFLLLPLLHPVLQLGSWLLRGWAGLLLRFCLVLPTRAALGVASGVTEMAVQVN